MKNRILEYWQGKLNRMEMNSLLDDLNKEEEAISKYEAGNLGFDDAQKDTLVPYDATEVLQKIHLRIDIKKEKHLQQRYSLYRLLAAAMLVMAMGTGFFWYRAQQEYRSDVGKMSSQFEKQNPTDKAIQFLLPDGSTVVLGAHSRLRYRHDKIAHQRLVELEGKGLFHVFGDSKNPFSVLGEGYATTALGTKFIVDNSKTGKLVKVRLLEGRVVVRNAGNNKFEIKNVYLLPGDRLTIDLSKKLVVFNNGDDSPRSPKRFRTASAPKSNVTKRQAVNLNFHQTPLDTVFRRLGESRRVEIRFEPATVEGLTFTGNLNNIDNLDLLLKAVCHPNQLQFEYQNGRYMITKTIN